MNARALKKTALRLHGLAKSDREWILQRLPISARLRVENNLKELNKTGISSNRELIEKIINGDLVSASVNDTEITVASKEDALDIIESAHVAKVKKCLAGEPLMLAAIILSVKDWDWKAEYLSSMSQGYRKDISSLSNNELRTIKESVVVSAIEEFAKILSETSLSGDNVFTVGENGIFENVGLKRQASTIHKNWWDRLWQ